jgi:hypothetical protein
MQSFLQRFAVLVAGVLQGFDRLVFKGRLRQLYAPQGMHFLLAANHVACADFKKYSARVTQQLMDGPCVQQAKQEGRFRYLNSSGIDKEKLARQIATEHRIDQGLVCVLQCVEPCWTFDKVKNDDGFWIVRGERGKCSHLYHYFIHPHFGWLYLRLQTWFPFEIQIGLNGREWLARQLDRANVKYERSANKFLWIEDWQRAQQLFDEQVQTDWISELDALQQQLHPVHPSHLGKLPAKYNWTGFQTEWATDVAFHSAKELEPLFDRWLRQAFLSYDTVDVLRFFGRSKHSQRVSFSKRGCLDSATNVHACFEGKRIKHWLQQNSLKMYTHHNVLRTETTINNPKVIIVERRSETDPQWRPLPRPIRSGVVDMPHRAVVGQQVNERYLEALASLAQTRTIKELAEPLTRRVPEPRSQAGESRRHLRGLNPLAEQDAELLALLSKPEWMINGLKNRDLVAALYKTKPADGDERRRRSSRVTRLLRLLRAHGLVAKIPHTHRYQVSADARNKIQALLAVRNANPDELTTKAA